MSEEGGKIKIIKYDGKTLVFELVGEDHTMANLIAKYLIYKDHVKYAAYHIPHPLISNPVIRLVTDGTKDPFDVLLEVLEDIVKDSAMLKKALAEALSSGTHH